MALTFIPSRYIYLSSFVPGTHIVNNQEFYPNGSLQDLLDCDTSLSENHALRLASEMVSETKLSV